MKKTLVGFLVLISFSSFASIKCEIFQGLEPVENETPYASCEFDYEIQIMGIKSYVRSCTLDEKDTDISYTFGLWRGRAGVVADRVTAERSDSAGKLPGTRVIYLNQSEDRNSERTQIYHYGTTRVECLKN